MLGNYAKPSKFSLTTPSAVCFNIVDMLTQLADRLLSVGVYLDVYPGFPHAFGYFPELPSATKLERDLLEGIKKLMTGKLESI